MSDNFLGPKPVRSVAAFLWMPQFRLSFQHMSHLAPVFVRTLAGVFAGAGLIARNHPALLYGSPEVNSRDAGFSALIGDAWFSLRSSKSGVSQWGLFIGVALLLALTFMALLTTVATIAFGVGTSAQAQLFSHPLGDSSVDGHVPAPPYDMAVPASGTPQGDYGIMMLDKVVRAGASGQGIPMQNALRDLMLVYNSAVLVIASVILFWMIVSVVVDTAKTGQVGGGRHNMVWGPIRIVFALALLIPLGSAGFSSGQYMVMKVAEWGNNLGTNAWTAYVRGTMSASNIVADYATSPATTLIKDYEKMWVCAVSYNAAMGKMNSPERMVKRNSIGNPLDGKRQFELVAQDNHSCGTLVYEDSNYGLDVLQTYVGTDFTGQADQISRRLDLMKRTMREQYSQIFFSLEPKVKQAACRFASTSVLFSSRADRTLLSSQPECAGAGIAIPSEGQNATSPTVATLGYGDIQEINAEFGQRVEAALQSQIGALRNAFQDRSMLDMMTERGWAGMGAWYHRIAQINAVTASLTKPPITVMTHNLGQKGDHVVIRDTLSILKSYDEWWLAYTVSNGSAPQINRTTGGTQSSSMDVSGEERKTGLTQVLRNLASGDSNVIDVLLDAMGLGPRMAAGIVTALGGGENIYPLAQLTTIGDHLVAIGTLFHVALLIVHAIMALLSTEASVLGIGGGLDLGPLAESYFFKMMGAFATIFLAAGLMLKFYIPLIPFMRVIFSVLTWIISVFEAVVMVPIAALAHLSLEGEGLAGGAKNVWILWLNVLLRPILTVIGFIGAMLVFNAFVSFFNDNFSKSLAAGLPAGGFAVIYSLLVMMVIYVFIIYTVANTVFKMLDIIPSAMMRWLGGSPDQSFDNDGDKAALIAASNMLKGLPMPGGGKKPEAPKKTPKMEKDDPPPKAT